MGYYSEVAYTIRFCESDEPEVAKKNKELFYTFLAEAKVNPETSMCFDEGSGLVIVEDKMHLNFYASSCKWYEGDYEDVDCHVSLLSMAKEYIDDTKYETDVRGEGSFRVATINYRLGYMFSRIGEDTVDIEEDGGGEYSYEWIEVNRSLGLDW